MQVNLIKDAQGRVLGSFEAGKSSGGELKPKLGSGQTVSTAELSHDYAKKLGELYGAGSSKK
ncbi:MAG TPA: hypothetical protein VF018_14025 [Acidobacteriaceae bacterium]